VLVVDDEPGIRAALKQILEYEKLEVHLASSGGEALTVYPELRPHVVFLDVKMAGLDGLETLARLRELDPDAMVIMISGHATVATAIEATRRGAFDFLEKPLDSDRLLVTVRNALKHEEISGEYLRLRRDLDARSEMVGDSAGMNAVRDVIARVGPTAARVLITGENGTGKELVARAIHYASPRRDRPFVEVNCAAIPSELIESELFGHMKGSFTGAVSDRAGKFEQADGGTLFLDEIGDMSPAAQAKVLRALQEGVITRVGGAKPIQVDVRIIAATNKNLEEEISAGRFREDLFYRLNVVPVHVPALRDRPEEVPALVKHFRRQMAGAGGAARKTIDPGAIQRLQQRSWPGNVRELRNAVERLLILSTGKTITAGDVQHLLGGGAPGEPAVVAAPPADTFEEYMSGAERAFITAKLEQYDWNVTETARALQMPRSNLYKRIMRYGLERETPTNE
jgi:two-component system nitrogen regulation response regulator NtrX